MMRFGIAIVAFHLFTGLALAQSEPGGTATENPPEANSAKAEPNADEIRRIEQQIQSRLRERDELDEKYLASKERFGSMIDEDHHRVITALERGRTDPNSISDREAELLAWVGTDEIHRLLSQRTRKTAGTDRNIGYRSLVDARAKIAEAFPDDRVKLANLLEQIERDGIFSLNDDQCVFVVRKDAGLPLLAHFVTRLELALVSIDEPPNLIRHGLKWCSVTHSPWIIGQASPTARSTPLCDRPSIGPANVSGQDLHFDERVASPGPVS